MTKENGVKVLTDMVADFVAHIGKKLPDDVVTKLEELGSQESAALPKVLYETMTKNQGLAVELNRPSCQDTGVLQFWLKCGTNFPYINELEALLKEAVVQATFAAPLRHNSVETFDEYNTKKNVGKGTPTVWWDIVPNSDKCEIYAYMAGGGCTLPGKAMVLMPDGVPTRYVPEPHHHLLAASVADYRGFLPLTGPAGGWTRRRGPVPCRSITSARCRSSGCPLRWPCAGCPACTRR